jgi:hypothetical protein
MLAHDYILELGHEVELSLTHQQDQDSSPGLQLDPDGDTLELDLLQEDQRQEENLDNQILELEHKIQVLLQDERLDSSQQSDQDLQQSHSPAGTQYDCICEKFR